MAFTAHDPRVFYDAVVSRLETSTGKSIGRAEAPTSVTTPYAVLYPQTEDDLDTSLADPFDVTAFNFQVTSVGDSLEQALWMQQKIRAALLGWTPVVTGLICMPVLRDGGQSVQRDDSLQPPKFFTADVFTVLAD